MTVTTRLSDVIVPAVFTPYMIQRSVMTSALYRAGIITLDPQINALAKGPSNQVSMPYWNDIGGNSNVGSDDPDVKSTPQKIGASKDVSQKQFRNNSWSSADLTGVMVGQDPMRQIADLVADYWQREMQRLLILELKGVIASNIANNGGDMVLDVSTDAAGAVAAGEKISANLILAGKQTMGDAAGKLTAIGMHSMLHTELQRQSLIAYIPNDQANIGWGTYMGYTVVVDDACPAVAGTNRIRYTSYLFGRGAIGYGEGEPKVPTAVTRDEAAGNGEGMEILTTRRHFIMHPRGVKWTAASLAGAAPTDVELATAGNWSRVYDRKNVRLVALVTNG